MKVLVLSDSHSNIDRMCLAVEAVSPDVVVHLGDHYSDAQNLEVRFPDLVFYMVKGNCDFQSGVLSELSVSVGGVQLLLSHGHFYGVKSGLSRLAERARSLGADIALYGHTHRAATQREDGLVLLCPGQLERHDRGLRASYGVIQIEDGAFECEIGVI